jgi:bacteriorhodopsin
MSTLTNEIALESQAPRSRMLWVLFAAIAAGQLFAFWLLCSHQVRKAQARQNEIVVQQMALSDCLQYIPGSTIASCSARGDVNTQAAPASEKSALSGPVPVSFSFR